MAIGSRHISREWHTVSWVNPHLHAWIDLKMLTHNKLQSKANRAGTRGFCALRFCSNVTHNRAVRLKYITFLSFPDTDVVWQLLTAGPRARSCFPSSPASFHCFAVLAIRKPWSKSTSFLGKRPWNELASYIVSFENCTSDSGSPFCQIMSLSQTFRPSSRVAKIGETLFTHWI